MSYGRALLVGSDFMYVSGSMRVLRTPEGSSRNAVVVI